MRENTIAQAIDSGNYQFLTPAEAKEQGYRRTPWRSSSLRELTKQLKDSEMQTEIAKLGLEYVIVDSDGFPHVMYQVQAENFVQRFVLYARQRQVEIEPKGECRWIL
jgi:hypothetical protein